MRPRNGYDTIVSVTAGRWSGRRGILTNVLGGYSTIVLWPVYDKMGNVTAIGRKVRVRDTSVPR